MLELPGLIDPHVHLRDPGATHKEDFASGTAAALAGGFTMVLAMPNTDPPLTDHASLARAKAAAQAKARCDYGFFLGASEENHKHAADLAKRVCGLKMYTDQTYGTLRLEGLSPLLRHVQGWPRGMPIAAHAEGRSLAAMLLLAGVFQRPVHFCHVSRKEEILLIRAVKERGFPVTCEVTPHHLLLTRSDQSRIGAGRSEVRPPLASSEDRQALWENLDVIDCFATDHAPHKLSEKDSTDPPPGFPGLETALGLLLQEVHQGRLTLDDLVLRMYKNPKRIFGLPDQPETSVLVDPNLVWEVERGDLYTRCGWSPFEGMPLRGRVKSVVLRGKSVFEDGKVLAAAGSGEDIVSSIQRRNL